MKTKFRNDTYSGAVGEVSSVHNMLVRMISGRLNVSPSRASSIITQFKKVKGPLYGQLCKDVYNRSWSHKEETGERVYVGKRYSFTGMPEEIYEVLKKDKKEMVGCYNSEWLEGILEGKLDMILK